MVENNPNKIDHLSEPNTPCLAMKSEMNESFQSPILKNPTVTRAKRFEQFLWHEFYAEYIRAKQRLEAMRPDEPTSEYFDEFGKRKGTLNDIEVAGKILTNKYPLYATAAISKWNPKGDFACNFRRTASISIPTSEQRGKFDD